MKKKKEYVLVCTSVKPKQWSVGCCQNRGGDALFEAFEKKVKELELDEKILIRKCGCLNNCKNGVSVRILNDATVYSRVKKEDIPEIIGEHCEKGNLIERLIEEYIP